MRKRRFRAKTLSKVTEVPIHPSPRIPLHRWIKKVLLPVQQPSFIPPIIFVGDLPCLAFRSKQLSVVFDLGREFFNGWSFQVGLTWWCPLSRGRSVKSSSYSSRLSSCRALNTCYMLFIGCNMLMKLILIAIMVKWSQWKCLWRPLAEELHGIQEVRGGGVGSFWQKPASSPHPSKLPANNHQPPICLFFLYPSRYNNFHDCIYRDKCQRNHDAQDIICKIVLLGIRFEKLCWLENCMDEFSKWLNTSLSLSQPSTVQMCRSWLWLQLRVTDWQKHKVTPKFNSA